MHVLKPNPFPPWPAFLPLQAFPMVGYPILPTATFSFADPGSSKWRWMRRQQQQQQQRQPPAAAAATAADGGWEYTGCSSMCYTPTERDLGCVLRVECTPGLAAVAAAAAAEGQSVQPPPAAATAAAAGDAAGDVVYGEAVTAEMGKGGGSGWLVVVTFH